MHDLLFIVPDFSTVSGLIFLESGQVLVVSIGWLQRVVGHSCAVSVGKSQKVLGASGGSSFLGFFDLLGERGI